MRPVPETGVRLDESQIFITFRSEEAIHRYFNSNRAGHYHVNREYVISRQKPIDWKYSAMFVVRGQMILITSGKEYTINPNEYFIIDMDKPHIYASYADDTEFFWFCFDGNDSDTFVENILKKTHVYIPLHLNRIYDAFYDVVYRGKETPLDEIIISSLIHVILADALSQKNYTKNHELSDIEKAATYLERNFERQISIGNLAQMLFLNPSYFSRKFKQEKGVSPKTYLMNIRLNAAKLLLTDTNLSVHELSEKVGFTDDTYFITYFKNRYGVTPLEYRKRIQKK